MSSSHLALYDVFLSFRGEDTRKNFVSHLYNSLVQKGVSTFIDDKKLERGGSISPELLHAIEASKISVIILSENYATSSWCLNELMKILECRKSHGQIVVPIFYNVDPSHVKKQEESYATAFAQHKRTRRNNMGQIQKWKEALAEVATISGWDSRGRDEFLLIGEIVKDILDKLLSTMSGDVNNLVGMVPIIEKIELLLCMGSDDVHMVGIWGMPGIGKTTIAQVIYDQLCRKFEAHCFIESVKDKFRNRDRASLQEEFLSSILLMERNPSISSLYRGFSAIRDILGRKKVLIVLDDVDDVEQLESLARKHEWFGPGSRIIITTRDKHLLHQHGVDKVYEVKGMENDDALHLFSLYAFRQNHPMKEFEHLSMHAIKYAGGLPLALKVLGSFLYGKNVDEWEDGLNKLEMIPHKKIQDVLKISFMTLDEEEKELFLDIACFFEGWEQKLVAEILERCGLFPVIGIRVLVERSLVNISRNKLHMHDLMQKMGREIVRQESIKEPGQRSRLWRQEDVFHVLQYNTGSEKVEGIMFNMYGMKGLHVRSKTFARMHNLKILSFDKFHSKAVTCTPEESQIYLFEGLEYLPAMLRYLCWHGCPLKSLPTSFVPENLVVLKMPCSRIKRLWKGVKSLDNLKYLDLSYSQYLIETPNLSRAPRLENIILEGCVSLVKFHPSIEQLSRLAELNLKGCIKLGTIPVLTDRGSCEAPIPPYYSTINKMPKSSRTDFLTTMNLDGTAIKELTSSLEHIPKLMTLSLENCRNLRALPSSISKLKSLETLSLNGCSKFKFFPEILETLPCLTSVDLSHTAIRYLPSSIDHLECLKILVLEGCRKLQSVPTSICNLRALEYLRVLGCRNLEMLPRRLGNLKLLWSLDLTQCYKLWGISERANNLSISNLNALGAGVNELPSSPFCLPNLKILRFPSSPSRMAMRYLWASLPFLCSLRNLDLYDCNLKKIPKHLECLFSLEVLNLGRNKFKKIPKCIKHLPKLELLAVDFCTRLTSLPDLPPRLRYVYAHNCTSLRCITVSNISKVTLEYSRLSLEFTDCSQFDALNIWDVISSRAVKSQLFICNRMKSLVNGERELEQEEWTIETCHPGSNIPPYCTYKTMGSSISLEFNGNMLSYEWAIIMCAVFSPEKPFSLGSFRSLLIRCDCCLASGEKIASAFFNVNPHNRIQNFSGSDHIFVGYSTEFIDKQWKSTNSLPTKVTFEFKLAATDDNMPYPLMDMDTASEELQPFNVKSCGIHPIKVHPENIKDLVLWESREGGTESSRSDNEGEDDPNPKRLKLL